MAKIHGILIKNGQLSEAFLEDKLEVYYRELECDLIDIVNRKIGGKYFDIVCDEEGLYHDGFISMMTEDSQQPLLVGNLFICNHDGPNLASLEESDIKLIRQHWKHHIIWGDY